MKYEFENRKNILQIQKEMSFEVQNYEFDALKMNLNLYIPHTCMDWISLTVKLVSTIYNIYGKAMVNKKKDFLYKNV